MDSTWEFILPDRGAKSWVRNKRGAKGQNHSGKFFKSALSVVPMPRLLGTWETDTSPPGKRSSGTRVFLHQEVGGGHLGTSGMKKTELEILGEQSATLGEGHRNKAVEGGAGSLLDPTLPLPHPGDTHSGRTRLPHWPLRNERRLHVHLSVTTDDPSLLGGQPGLVGVIYS